MSAAPPPAASSRQILNMSLGFVGIQFGWGLQMANMSSIYEYLGADAHQIPLLWLAAFWLVQATIFTVFDRWEIDGQAYLAADYYRRVFAGYAPWLLGGIACLVASRHVN